MRDAKEYALYLCFVGSLGGHNAVGKEHEQTRGWARCIGQMKRRFGNGRRELPKRGMPEEKDEPGKTGGRRTLP